MFPIHDKMALHFAYREDGIRGYLHQLKREAKCVVQRVKRGWCDFDIINISDWFLSVIPSMLEEYKKNKSGAPCKLFGEDPTGSHVVTGNPEIVKKWDEILDKMIFLFREANEETCQKKNPYEDEHMRIFDEFTKKYGMLGEKLMTEEERNNPVGSTMHFAREIPEYTETEDKYLEAHLELKEYRKQCLKDAMALFTEWFWELWD